MLAPGFIPPRYDTGCFAHLPATVQYALTGQSPTGLDPELLAPFEPPCQTVVLFFIDAFGWRFFAPRAESYPFLADIGRQGSVAQLTEAWS